MEREEEYNELLEYLKELKNPGSVLVAMIDNVDEIIRKMNERVREIEREQYGS